MPIRLTDRAARGATEQKEARIQGYTRVQNEVEVTINHQPSFAPTQVESLGESDPWYIHYEADVCILWQPAPEGRSTVGGCGVANIPQARHSVEGDRRRLYGGGLLGRARAEEQASEKKEAVCHGVPGSCLKRTG